MGRPEPYYALSDDSISDDDLPPYAYSPAGDHRLALAGIRPSPLLPPTKPHILSLLVVRLFPIAATVSWLFTLLLLLFAWWHLDSAAKYKWYLGGMPYISDVGAVHKSFFRWGCASTAVFYALSLWTERWLRSRRILVEATEERMLWVRVGVWDVTVGTAGAAALVLLSIYDAFDHPRLHNLFMSAFIISVAVSGALQTVEVEHLMHEHPDRLDLLDATYLKWIFLTLAVLSGGGFWGMYYICTGDATKVLEGGDGPGFCWRVTSASAVLEWVACFMCDAYLATLILDIWPAYRHTPLQHRAWATAQGVQGIHVLQPDGSFQAVHFAESTREKMVGWRYGPGGMTGMGYEQTSTRVGVGAV